MKLFGLYEEYNYYTDSNRNIYISSDGKIFYLKRHLGRPNFIPISSTLSDYEQDIKKKVIRIQKEKLNNLSLEDQIALKKAIHIEDPVGYRRLMMKIVKNPMIIVPRTGFYRQLFPNGEYDYLYLIDSGMIWKWLPEQKKMTKLRIPMTEFIKNLANNRFKLEKVESEKLLREMKNAQKF